MAVGWIKLHRKIMESSLWSDEPFDERSAWVDLLLMANYEDKQILFNGKSITVKAGQRITSIRKLAHRWHWSNGKVERYLKKLEDAEMISRKRDTNGHTNRDTLRDKNGTLITIVNYGFYQGMRDTNEDTNRDTNRDTNGVQTRIYKNIKKERKEPLNDSAYDESFELLMKGLGGKAE